MDILSNPAEAPRADPHAGCCGGWGLNTPGYPIRRYPHHTCLRCFQYEVYMHSVIRKLDAVLGAVEYAHVDERGHVRMHRTHIAVYAPRRLADGHRPRAGQSAHQRHAL